MGPAQGCGLVWTQPKLKVVWKSVLVPPYGLIQRLGRNAIKICQIRVEQNTLARQYDDPLRDADRIGLGSK